LAQVLEDARHKPYVLGEHDCFRVACAVVQALTGVDHWPMFCGYNTKREALLRIAAYGGTFRAAGDRLFGVASSELVLHARRGDIAALADLAGELHLGVVTGTHIWGVSGAGVVQVPVTKAQYAWSIG
jgi:hypothetical protein